MSLLKMYVATHETSSQATGNALLHNVFVTTLCGIFSLKPQWPKNMSLYDTVFNNDMHIAFMPIIVIIDAK